MNMNLVGIAGLPRTGKDTIAEYLEDRYGFEVTSFARPLKEATKALFHLDDFEAFDDAVKDMPIQPWNLSPREMWCALADGVKYRFGDDIFVKLWAHQVMLGDADNIVVSDVRYEAEADMVRKMGGKIIHLSRPDAPRLAGQIAQHSSNKGIEVKVGDYVLSNDGSLDELYGKVDDILEDWT